MKVAGDLILAQAHELLQTLDIKGHIFEALNKIVPFKTGRQLTDRSLRLKASGNTSDDNVGHF